MAQLVLLRGMQEKYLMDAARRNGTLKICPNCGKEFVKDSVFCCNACYQEDRAKKKEYTKYLRDNGLKVCEECGKEFSGLGNSAPRNAKCYIKTRSLMHTKTVSSVIRHFSVRPVR